jgi:hypothetical protein
MPNVRIIGITGKIKRSCLLGKKECIMKNIITGSMMISVFLEFLKNPKSRKRLIGGINVPMISNE